MPGARLFMCLSLAQGLTRPITPMGLAAFRLIGSSVARLVGSAARRPARRDPSRSRSPGSACSSTSRRWSSIRSAAG